MISSYDHHIPASVGIKLGSGGERVTKVTPEPYLEVFHLGQIRQIVELKFRPNRTPKRYLGTRGNSAHSHTLQFARLDRDTSFPAFRTGNAQSRRSRAAVIGVYAHKNARPEQFERCAGLRNNKI